VAEQADLNATQLYRTLSADGNPALSSFSAILKAMGMRISVQAAAEPRT
jgi:DNA-binding phage protein